MGAVDAVDRSSAPTAHGNLSSQETTVEEAFKRGFDDLQYFAEMCLPFTMLFKWPTLYISIWLMLVKAQSSKERAKVIRFALGLPRGFAKTTFIKVLVCWLVVYDKITFVLIVCATEPHASNFLADVDDILASPNIERVYGAWTVNKAIDSAQLKKAAYRRRVVIIAAIGSETSLRGLNIANQRPDFIICDDMQSALNAESDTESQRLLVWFTGTMLKAVSPFYAMVVYVGNMYPRNCILAKLQENQYWISLVTGCILVDKKSLWEELHPLNSLLESFKHDESLGLGHVWFAEMMNQPLMANVSLLPDGTIPESPLKEEAIIADAGFIIIDPAGFKSNADDNVIVACLVVAGLPYVVRIVAGNFTPLEVIHKSVHLALELNIRIFFVEEAGYQATLRFWFEHELSKPEVNLAQHFIIKPLSPKNRQKEGRIKVAVKQILSKLIFFANLEARQRYVFQALAYKLGKPKNKDDTLDAVAYVEDVRTTEWQFVHSVPMNKPESRSAHVVGNNTPF